MLGSEVKISHCKAKCAITFTVAFDSLSFYLPNKFVQHLKMKAFFSMVTN